MAAVAKELNGTTQPTPDGGRIMLEWSDDGTLCWIEVTRPNGRLKRLRLTIGEADTLRSILAEQIE